MDESLRDAAAYPITGCTHLLPRRLKGKCNRDKLFFSLFLSLSQAFNLLANQLQVLHYLLLLSTNVFCHRIYGLYLEDETF